MKDIKNEVFALIVIGLLIVLGILLFLILGSNRTKTYKISFNTETNVKIDSMNVTEGEAFILPKVTRDGYDFKGWFLDDMLINESYKFTKDVTLNAKWELRGYTVSFDSDGGSSVGSISVEHNGKLVLPENPIKSGYTFVSWKDANGNEYIGGEEITNDITLKATWKANGSSSTGTNTNTKTFEVRLNATGTGGSVLTVKCGDPLPTLPIPTRTGFTFVGWFTTKNVAVSAGQVLACNDVTLIARWTYNGGGASTPTPRVATTPRVTVTPKTTTKTATPLPVRTATPKVTAAPSGQTSMTITFDSTGGTSANPITVKCGEALPTLPKPTKSGSAFMYWSNPEDNRPISAGSKLNYCKNITVKANWYTIPTGPTG